MTPNHAQALPSQSFATSASPRRRFVPPSLPGPVPQSLNQRWRERPRCPALRVPPGHRDGVVHAIVGRAAGRCPRAQVVQDGRTTRVHVVASGFAGTTVPTKSTEMGPRTSYGVLEDTLRSWIQILRSHHRAFHSGAVLGVVNALRFASTRPVAGPSGIDDASARHALRSYAMVVSVSMAQTRLTRESHRRMLASSSQCPTALPPFAPRANGARIRSAPTGHDIERPQTPQTDARRPRVVRRRVY